jgi:hypothetical protein
MRHPLEEEQLMYEETERFRRLYGPNRKQRWYRQRLGNFAYECCGLFWRVAANGTYVGIAHTGRVIRYAIARDERGYWVSRQAARQNKYRGELTPTKGEPIGVFKRVTDAMRATELFDLRNEGINKWQGLVD